LTAYTYIEHGGTANAARQLGAPDHAVIKTIVLETDAKAPLICLMHGDREISTKQLARALGVKHVGPCTPDTANRHTGYMIGGTSPFGTRKPLPVYAEATIFELPEIWINAGRRGVLARMSPAVLELVKPVRVNVAVLPAP
jgi:Cys-tRNA(Pro) deacylase